MMVCLNTQFYVCKYDLIFYVIDQFTTDTVNNMPPTPYAFPQISTSSLYVNNTPSTSYAFPTSSLYVNVSNTVEMSTSIIGNKESTTILYGPSKTIALPASFTQKTSPSLSIINATSTTHSTTNSTITVSSPLLHNIYSDNNEGMYIVT